MEVSGLPDSSAVPSTMLNFQSTTTYTPTAGAVGTWDCLIQCWPDATQPVYVQTADSVSGFRNFALFNRQLGTSQVEAIGYLASNVQRHRLVYYGATVYVDAPSLSDQGSIVAYQAPVTINEVSFSTDTDVALVNTHSCAQLAEQFDLSCFPSYTTGLAMPNAYTGLAKHGCYMPLKLTENHQQWRGTESLRSYGQAWGVVRNGFGTPLRWSPDAGPAPPLPRTNFWPYPDLEIAYLDTNDGLLKGGRLYRPLSENVGNVCIVGMSPAASVRVVLRYGIECQVQPGTLLSTHLKVSPAFDRQAIDEYFMIARELKDAYPADYNDWGKLWSVIKTAANAVAPALSVFGPVGAGIGSVIPLATGAVDRLIAPKGDKPPAAALERAQEAIKAQPFVARQTVSAKALKRAKRRAAKAALRK